MRKLFLDYMSSCVPSFWSVVSVAVHALNRLQYELFARTATVYQRLGLGHRVHPLKTRLLLQMRGVRGLCFTSKNVDVLRRPFFTGSQSRRATRLAALHPFTA